MADIIIPGIPASALPLATPLSPGMMSAAQNIAVDSLPWKRSTLHMHLEDAATWDGGNVGQWDNSLFSDFGSAASTGAVIFQSLQTLSGGATIAQSGASSILFSAVTGSAAIAQYFVVYGGIQNTKWSLRFRCNIVDSGGSAAVYLKDFDGNTQWIGVEFGHSDGKVRVCTGGGTPAGSDGGTVLITNDANFHTYELRCDGSGVAATCMQARADGGAWVTQAITASTGTIGNLRIVAAGATLELDYLSLLRKTTRT